MFCEPVEQLRAFADEFDITIPLLSDPESRIIRELGILNTTLDESDEPFFGIPYPGSYIVGADGNVASKFFEQNSLVRTHPGNLLRAALGRRVEEIEAPPAAPVAEVEFDVSFGADSLQALLLTDLFVDIRVPPGQHLYGAPVPDGLVVTSVTIDAHDRVVAQHARFPPTHPMTLGGTGETLHVYEGDVRVRLPLLYNGRRVEPGSDGVASVEVTGTIRWQSCDDDVCHIPRTERFAITIPVEPPNVPGMLNKAAPADL